MAKEASARKKYYRDLLVYTDSDLLVDSLHVGGGREREGGGEREERDVVMVITLTSH